MPTGGEEGRIGVSCGPGARASLSICSLGLRTRVQSGAMCKESRDAFHSTLRYAGQLPFPQLTVTAISPETLDCQSQCSLRGPIDGQRGVLPTTC